MFDFDTIYWCTNGYCSYFANTLAKRTGLQLGYILITKGTCKGLIDHWFCHTAGDITIYDIEGKFTEEEYKRHKLVCDIKSKLVYSATQERIDKFTENLDDYDYEYDCDTEWDKQFISRIPTIVDEYVHTVGLTPK